MIIILEVDYDLSDVMLYTRESGVRNLEREISKVARKVVKKVVNGEEKKVTVNDKNIPDFLRS